MCFILLLNTYNDPKMTIYYESEWGLWITTLSLFASILAHCSDYWTTIAVYSSEVCKGYNLIISPIFWLIMATSFMQKIWEFIENFDPDTASKDDMNKYYLYCFIFFENDLCPHYANHLLPSRTCHYRHVLS